MPRSKRTPLKVIAAVVGVIATSIPMILFNAWLKKQGEDEVSLAAARALGSAEIQLGQTVAAVRELAAGGIDSCGAPQRDAMRQAVLRTGPLKAIMLIAPGGQVMCTDSAGSDVSQELLSSTATASEDIVLDVVAVSGSRADRFLRVRKFGENGGPGVAALVSPSLLLPHTSMHGGRFAGYARLLMPDNSSVAEFGLALDQESEAQFESTAASKPYRVSIVVSMPRNGVIANYDDLRRIGTVVTGLVALMILVFALIFPWRYAENPIAAIARALLTDEFIPYYQPVVDIQSGRLLGAEVLVRWRRSDGSFAEPVSFVSLIEASGLAVEMTRLLMRRVRDDVGAALAKRRHMWLAFNVTPQHFDDTLILNDIGTIFGNSPIRLSQLVLELSERYQIEDLAVMRRTVAALQKLGCRIAIDDVGTGHSGLSYVLKLGVDIIKIDDVLVEAIGTEIHTNAIIETLIDLAKNMRIDLIAEGVETFDQVTYLRDRGIGAAQGFVFAPPLPASSFLQLLEAMDPATGAGPAETRTAERPLVA